MMRAAVLLLFVCAPAYAQEKPIGPVRNDQHYFDIGAKGPIQDYVYKVADVIDGKSLRVRMAKDNFQWVVRGVDATGLVDGMEIQFAGRFHVTKTEKIAGRVMFVLEALEGGKVMRAK